MKTIKLKIADCLSCPYSSSEDSGFPFDKTENWFCNLERRMIQSNVECNKSDSIEIPEWCSIVVKEENGAKSKKTYFNSEMGLKIGDDKFREKFGTFIDNMRESRHWGTWSSYYIGDQILQFLLDNKKLKIE